jgi:lon-related putative ATP-dependent protease
MAQQDPGTAPPPLDAAELYRVCDPAAFDFETTDELADGEPWVGQDRLISSIGFGMGMPGSGYNIFALGPRDTDKRELVEAFLERRTRGAPVPPDLCYVHNFDEPYRPRILPLPAGVGGDFCRAMDALVADLETSLVAAFESEEYQNRRTVVQESAQEEQGEDFERLQERAREMGLALIRTPVGFGFLPLKDDGEVMEEEDLEKLTDERRTELEERSGELQEELQALLRTMPARNRKIRGELMKLDREIATFAVKELVDAIRGRFHGEAPLLAFLDAVQADIVDNVQAILGAAGQRQGSGGGKGLQLAALSMDEGDAEPGRAGGTNPLLSRYRVNLLVDHAETSGAPVVYEEHPTYKNLVGRIEHRSRMGALTTDFSLIRAGALHRANGGYLVLDARSVLLEPFAWEALKRVLHTGRLKIESLGQSYSPLSTVSLEPEPVPLDVKVVLLGERMIYYLLHAHDPDFPSLFQVEADFEDEMAWDGPGDLGYTRFLAGLVRSRGLRPFRRDAVARVMEEGARLAGDQQKLSTRTREIDDLLQQANHWAGEAGRHEVTAADVQQAIDQQVYRASRIRDRVREQILRDTVLVDTTGTAVGQVNGLSVMRPGRIAFGSPSRITARVALGDGEIVDIEREVEMGGPLHSKGVLILKGLLAERFARRKPLSLRASLVFEQSYGGVDGDSASVAEFVALLSALARVPLLQSRAVTGSVNQHGQVQAIGGVNEKVEGFFDLCRERGLTGDQGVLIPRANVKHLMLRSDVVEAVREGRFHVYPMDTVDQALELLSGVPAGEAAPDGTYPEASFNGRVARELEGMAERLRAFARSSNRTAANGTDASGVDAGGADAGGTDDG